tara:strand:- start:825 stop:1022 length:198 start_codon:yes stop_codon:yes gene_type:complete
MITTYKTVYEALKSYGYKVPHKYSLGTGEPLSNWGGRKAYAFGLLDMLAHEWRIDDEGLIEVIEI